MQQHTPIPKIFGLGSKGSGVGGFTDTILIIFGVRAGFSCKEINIETFNILRNWARLESISNSLMYFLIF